MIGIVNYANRCLNGYDQHVSMSDTIPDICDELENKAFGHGERFYVRVDRKGAIEYGFNL